MHRRSIAFAALLSLGGVGASTAAGPKPAAPGASAPAPGAGASQPARSKRRHGRNPPTRS